MHNKASLSSNDSCGYLWKNRRLSRNCIQKTMTIITEKMINMRTDIFTREKREAHLFFKKQSDCALLRKMYDSCDESLHKTPPWNICDFSLLKSARAFLAVDMVSFTSREKGNETASAKLTEQSDAHNSRNIKICQRIKY